MGGRAIASTLLPMICGSLVSVKVVFKDRAVGNRLPAGQRPRLFYLDFQDHNR
jgi:hypothetical protein